MSSRQPSPALHRQVWMAIFFGYALLVTLTGTAVILWHHLFWMASMPHSRLGWVKGVTLIVTAATGGGWIRAGIAGFRLIRSHRQWSRLVSSRLAPLPHAPVWPFARWHLYAGDDLSGVTWGIFRAEIAISQTLWNRLTETERLAVMWHEAHHARYRVPLEKMLVSILDAVYPRWGYRQLMHHLTVTEEILADQWAITALGDDTPLIRALLKWLSAPTAPAPTHAGWEEALAARIRYLETHMLSDPPTRITWPVLPTAACELAILAQGIIFWCH